MPHEFRRQAECDDTPSRSASARTCMRRLTWCGLERDDAVGRDGLLRRAQRVDAACEGASEQPEVLAAARGVGLRGPARATHDRRPKLPESKKNPAGSTSGDDHRGVVAVCCGASSGGVRISEGRTDGRNPFERHAREHGRPGRLRPRPGTGGRHPTHHRRRVGGHRSREPDAAAGHRRTPGAGPTGNGRRDLRRREAGRTAAGRPGDRSNRQPGNGDQLHYRSSAKRGTDRTGRSRDAGPDRRLREPHAGAAASGLPGPESQGDEDRPLPRAPGPRNRRVDTTPLIRPGAAT